MWRIRAAKVKLQIDISVVAVSVWYIFRADSVERQVRARQHVRSIAKGMDTAGPALRQRQLVDLRKCGFSSEVALKTIDFLTYVLQPMCFVR